MQSPRALRIDDATPPRPRKADLVPLSVIARHVAAHDGAEAAGAVIERDFVMLEPSRPPLRFRRRH